jgi:methyl-accepting chemotaxis protein
MNPMTLTQDAPMGTWFYVFYETGTTELINGTFEVGPSSAAQIDAMLEDVRTDLSGLSDDVADLGGEFDALSDEIGDVSSDMNALRDNIVGDLADEISAATDAGNSALDAVEDLADSMADLGDAVGDIADIAGDAADASQAAADAANDAVTAAEEAQQSASGLTTLVYGAIGASLIAALAAIVSLMQISKRIAG